jgi:hypothetical protein
MNDVSTHLFLWKINVQSIEHTFKPVCEDVSATFWIWWHSCMMKPLELARGKKFVEWLMLRCISLIPIWNVSYFLLQQVLLLNIYWFEFCVHFPCVGPWVGHWALCIFELMTFPFLVFTSCDITLVCCVCTTWVKWQYTCEKGVDWHLVSSVCF